MRRANAGQPALGSAADLENVAGSDAGQLTWRRSSSCSQDSCVEVADFPDGGVAVRDGKEPTSSPVLVFTAQEWEAFVVGVKAGEFG